MLRGQGQDGGGGGRRGGEGRAGAVPSCGEEGSVAAELSLRAELLCSSGRLRMELLGTPVLGWCRFLFFTRMRPISSWGLGRGMPGASWWAQTGQGLPGRPHRIPPTPHRGAGPSYRVLVQWVNEQRVPKDGTAVLGHLGLLLCPVGPRSKVRGSRGGSGAGEVDFRRALGEIKGSRGQRSQEQIVPWWDGCLGPMGDGGCPQVRSPLTSPRGSQRRG